MLTDTDSEHGPRAVRHRLLGFRLNNKIVNLYICKCFIFKLANFILLVQPEDVCLTLDPLQQFHSLHGGLL